MSHVNPPSLKSTAAKVSVQLYNLTARLIQINVRQRRFITVNADNSLFVYTD